LPLLSGGRGGLGVFASPSVGYLLGFPIAALVAGLIVERTKGPVGLAALGGAIVGGIIVLHAFGIIGLSVMLDKTLLEAAAIDLPFLPGDAIKAGIAALITHAIAQMRPDALLSRA
jgi:biotin transport system substrate-specific component